ncbi:hypothetical protein EI94DRAFT_642036 [Lactarius quietus]|nr:hypothetical protein EI94DRAFT_642036 [Lactarius quietus]
MLGGEAFLVFVKPYGVVESARTTNPISGLSEATRASSQLVNRPLDVHPRLEAIAQGQSPATSHDRLSAVPARRAGLDEDPLNTPPLSMQPYKKRAVLQDFFLFSFSSVSVYSQLSLPEGALCATARAPDPSTFQTTNSPMTRLSYAAPR